MGFEPMIRVLQTLALATWPRRRAGKILPEGRGMVKFKQNSPFWGLERAMGRVPADGQGIK